MPCTPYSMRYSVCHTSLRQKRIFLPLVLSSSKTAIPAPDPSPCGVDREQDIASTFAVQATLAASERDSKYITMYIIPNKIAYTPINQTTASSPDEGWEAIRMPKMIERTPASTVNNARPPPIG